MEDLLTLWTWCVNYIVMVPLVSHRFLSSLVLIIYLAEVSNPQPTGHMQPRRAMNAAQHKIVNLLKTFFYFFCSSVCVSVCIFNVWPKTTLLPVWPRDAKRLDTPES